MGIEKGARWLTTDIFIDYPFEQVMFRWEHRSQQVFRRFYGVREEAQAVPTGNRLFNDAVLFGTEITFEKYAQAEPR